MQFLQMLIVVCFILLNAFVAFTAIMFYRWWTKHQISSMCAELYASAKGLTTVLKKVSSTMDGLSAVSSDATKSLHATCASLAGQAGAISQRVLNFTSHADKLSAGAEDLITFASVWGAIIALIAIFPMFVRKFRELLPETVAESLPRQKSLDKLEKVAYVLAYFAGAAKLLSYLRDWMRLDSVLVSLFDMSPGDLFDLLTFAKPASRPPTAGIGFVSGGMFTPTATMSPSAAASCHDAVVPTLSAAASSCATAWTHLRHLPTHEAVIYFDDYHHWPSVEDCARLSLDDSRFVREHLYAFIERYGMSDRNIWVKHAKSLIALIDEHMQRDVPQALNAAEMQETLQKCLTQWQESPRHFRLAMVLCLFVIFCLSWYIYDRMQEDDEDDDESGNEARRHFKQKPRRARASNEPDYNDKDKPDPNPAVVGPPELTDPFLRDKPVGPMLHRQPVGGKYVNTGLDWAAAAEEEEQKVKDKESKVVKPPVPPVVADAKKSRSQKRREKMREKIKSELSSSLRTEATMRDSRVSVVTGDICMIRDGPGDKYEREGRAFCLNGHMVTAMHCTNKEGKGWVLAPDGKTHELQFERQGIDIAVSKNVPPFSMKSLKSKPIAMKVGDKLLCRYSRDMLTAGQVVSVKDKRLEHNATTYAGWSGSPIVIGSSVVAVHTATNPALGVNVSEKLPLNLFAPGASPSAGSSEPKRQ